MKKNGLIGKLFGWFSKETKASSAQHAQVHPYLTFEGQLLRGERTAPVYKIEQGVKRWIVTEAVFLRKGFSWADVRVVHQSIIDNFTSGLNIT